MCCLRQFLYPSEEDLYKLIRFLVERLSEISEDRRTADVKDAKGRGRIKDDDQKSTSEDRQKKDNNGGVDLSCKKGRVKLEDLRLNIEVSEWLNTKIGDASLSRLHEADLIRRKMDEVAVDDVYFSRTGDFSKDKLTTVLSGKESSEEVVDAGRDTAGNEETAAWRDDKDVLVFEQKGSSFREQSSKIIYETGKTKNKEKSFLEERTTNNTGLRRLEEELELLRAAAEMAFDAEHPLDFYLGQLDEKIDAKKCNLAELESAWEALRESLEEKKRSLEESLYANNPEAQEKLQKLREVELEKQCVLSEIRQREEEHSQLCAELERQPKTACRNSYIQRIKEITKNSRKQDADIDRILKETRELQLESNSTQERLHRTYAVVDEMVFREAKKDPVGRQAYRLLTSFHEAFEQIYEKILATDRVQREVAEHEMKLAAMASRSLNVEKLQADLDAIRKENVYLQQCLRDN
ncbi:coiled-coil domain-containing protein 22 isoform X2 [Juglans regia]|uniref:Coiled-coil domain-containing protein 22 isoform X2 n=1 Tax=Juglans regia TaxID=51240 RepID=A0A2I4E227_JUGRE|nr:coiled-coil domain-containing protein 22 isoform X2 [Juglans regia]XP_018813454.1 coiled-coil domain-containing protein 22 isoform X2 [Juglans regia]